MKRYNKLKNLMLASATAALYYSMVVESVPMFNKVFGTACLFALMFILMCDADKAFIKYAKERRGENGSK